MREINREKGRVYNIDNHYYLEKIYDDLLDLINDEKELKERAKKGGFKILDYNWAIQNNENYKIEKILNAGIWKSVKPIKYVFTLKLELEL